MKYTDISTDIVSEIRTEHEAARRAAETALEHARRCGELLMKVKATIEHGAWLPWLAANCEDISTRTAQGYMKIAARWSELQSANTQRVSHLPIREALAALAEPRRTSVSIDTDEPAMKVPANVAMHANVTGPDGHWDALIQPFTNPDFVFVNVLFSVTANADASVEGTKRAIAREYVDKFLTLCRFPWTRATWQTSEPGVTPWTFNEWLYDSHAEYVRQAILGGVNRG